MNKAMTAIEAKFEAQRLAFGPFYFHAVIALRELGILDAIGKKRTGISQQTLAEQLDLSEYGVQVLLEAGLAANVLTVSDDEKYKLSKVGVFLKSDEMTIANMNFTKDVCYDGLKYLKDAVQHNAPEGLKVFGTHKTVYDALAHLNENVRKSWFAFDHYYSTDSFPYAKEYVFKEPVKKLLDIGGNTGKWTITCCQSNPDLQITLVDLPGQIANAKTNIGQYPFHDRVNYISGSVLSDELVLPTGFDVIWMSQFLDCFSSEEILYILKKVYDAADENTAVYIMESFWDNQKYEAGAYSIIALTLYFTAIANGNSKMFRKSDLLPLIEEAGFTITEEHALIGNTFNSLLKLQKT